MIYRFSTKLPTAKGNKIIVMHNFLLRKIQIDALQSWKKFKTVTYAVHPFISDLTISRPEHRIPKVQS